MAGESQQLPEGRADPTVLTTEALERGLKQEREFAAAQRKAISARLDGMDRATELLAETVNRVPNEVQREVAHLASVTDERFGSIQTQFKERDTRQERESRDNKVAVDAAFAAQKEAAAAQDKANRDQNTAATQAAREAIDKSERATAETIKSNQELNLARSEAQQKQLDDFGTRLTTIEASRQGGQEQRSQTQAQSQAGWAVFVGIGGLVLALVAVAVTILIATR